jgi:hypothetical protein
MDFRYRYVDYGTTFVPLAGLRDSGAAAAHLLFENELALDVGGCCLGDREVDACIIDHHFPRKYQFPAASAAVLHLAQRIYPRFAASFETVWLVTHREPDFDAFCSMYLAREIIASATPPPDWTAFGLHPEGWRDLEAGPGAGQPPRAFNWLDPYLPPLCGDQYWQAALAATAAFVDWGKPLHCPMHLALPSLLYAGLKRGRRFTDTGAVELFDAARQAIQSHRLNPLCDRVLDPAGEFAPEFDLLRGEPDAYARDLRRARTALVSVPRIPSAGFTAFYETAVREPLLDDAWRLRETHLARGQEHRQMDGIYIRDPESLFFKNWARQDTAVSSLGHGFTFTAIAYSGVKRGAPHNETDYYFSLDPERALGCHLYPVWALLQAAEIAELLKPGNVALRGGLEERDREAASAYRDLQQRARKDVAAAAELKRARATICRRLFEDRAGALAALFHDPWFDGMNYACTIVPTPNQGSLIGPPGTASDLADDPVAAVVRRYLEHGVYELPVRIVDFPAGSLAGAARPLEVAAIDGPVAAPQPGYFRFGKVPLRDMSGLTRGNLAEQIGRELWRLLNAGEETVPDDFLTHHLVKGASLVGVWSRRGVFVAYCSGAESAVRRLEDQFGCMAELSRELDSQLKNARAQPNPDSDRADARRAAEQAEFLMLRIADFEHELTQQGALLLRRMFEAIGITQALASVRDLHAATVERDQRHSTHSEMKELRHAQEKLEWLEILFVTLYATEIAHIVLGLLTEGLIVQARVVLAVAAVFGLLAALGLRKQRSEQGRSEWPLKAIPICLALLIAALFAFTWVPDPLKHLPRKSEIAPGSSGTAAIERPVDEVGRQESTQPVRPQSPGARSPLAKLPAVPGKARQTQ